MEFLNTEADPGLSYTSVPFGLLLHRQKFSVDFYYGVKVSLTAFWDKM